MLPNLTFLPLALVALCAQMLSADATVLTVRGEELKGALSWSNGRWSVGGGSLPAGDALVIRFSGDAPALRMDAGVFMRGGSLVAGTLVSLIGDNAEAAGSSLGALKFKREDLAGAFFPLPSGQSENMPALAHYSGILAATLGSFGAELTPGRQCRIRFAGLDEMTPDKVMRIGSEQILAVTKGKSIETVNRQFVRELEFPVAAAAPVPGDDKLGPEVVVRLKAGDLLRGRLIGFAGEGLRLRTSFMGERVIAQNLLAALFPVGGALNEAGVCWLSSQKPEKSVHTPVFDAQFPARYDATVDGGDMRIHGLPFERGLGVHSRSELVYALDGAPRRFVALCGIDDETNGRGGVLAKVLADGKEVWNSGELTAKDPAKLVNADLGNAKSLTLLVDYGADNDDSGDHFDWGWASVMRK
jgi:hypothetical protein